MIFQTWLEAETTPAVFLDALNYLTKPGPNEAYEAAWTATFEVYEAAVGAPHATYATVWDAVIEAWAPAIAKAIPDPTPEVFGKDGLAALDATGWSYALDHGKDISPFVRGQKETA